MLVPNPTRLSITPPLRLRRLYYQFRPALLTLSIVSLMLGLFLSVMIVFVAWIRTPETLLVSTDPELPRVVRGGESLQAIAGWLRAELGQGVALILAGWAGVLSMGRPTSSDLTTTES
jgi:hypothetical protein